MGSGTWPDSVEFWNNKCVMVTGGAGFLGRHVVAKLRKHGATQIEVVDRHRYDLRQLSDIRRALNECKPDEIYHLAAQNHIQINFDLPDYTGDVTCRSTEQGGV